MNQSLIIFSNPDSHCLLNRARICLHYARLNIIISVLNSRQRFSSCTLYTVLIQYPFHSIDANDRHHNPCGKLINTESERERNRSQFKNMHE